MAVNNKLVSWLLIVGFAVITTIIFYNFDYVENEGFNPTDEGVVLAQSWRIINGEIPHKDFISIRPAGSGYLHAINFIFPGPLVVNSRWFVLFQYFIISLVTSLFLFKVICSKFNIKGSPVTLISMVIAVFALTTLNYNLFPWTTVDALFWSCIALPLIFSEKNRPRNILGLIFLAFAALSRQTFALLSLLGNIYIIYTYRKEFLKVIPIILIGALPYIGYLIMLLVNAGLGDFINQMTGRSEIIQTAVLKFGKRFLSGMTTPFNFFIIFISILLIIRRKYDFIEMFVKKGIHAIILLLYVIFAIVLTVRHFVSKEFNAYDLPFELFFMYMVLIFFHFAIIPKKSRVRLISIAILLISWISAISLGANTPVFSVGIMFLGILFVSADILLQYPFQKVNFVKNSYLQLLVSIALFGVGYYGQTMHNYRDRPSDRLVNGLDYASKEFGNIRTNPSMVAYYSDLKDIYFSLDNAKDNIVVFPSNAIFYPIMNTKNPMSLDWLTHYEYIGLNDRISDDINEIISKGHTYFIVDKIDVKTIFKKIDKIEFNNDLIYNAINDKCIKIKSESDFFDVYKTVN